VSLNKTRNTAGLFSTKTVMRRAVGLFSLGLIMAPAVCAWGQQDSKITATPSSADEESSKTDRFGSVNVPMDSWVYPALERLANLGFIGSQSVTIRPWTRKECLRQLIEARDLYLKGEVAGHADGEVERLLSDLLREFNLPSDTPEAAVESIYVREGTIAGPALTDGYHFGQTWQDDYGRPLGRGNSAILGFSVRANRGRFFFYDRQELQQYPTVQGITPQLSKLINYLDAPNFPNYVPVTPNTPAGVRQRPIELYAGLGFGGTQLSFGKQVIYWGPTTTGPLSFSINAEPTYNLRLLATRPYRVPFTDGHVTYRFDLNIGKLSGHHYPARPYYNGQKAEFTFFDTLELGFTRWSILWGVGHPMTIGSLWRNLTSHDSTGSNFQYGDRSDPGDRKAGFDFRLHVPGLRKYVTIYSDSYSDDDVSPLNAPRRAVWSPGIYFPHLPLIPHTDLRVEMASSEELSQDEGRYRNFLNNQYRDGNTNKGFMLGNAVGRDARAIEGRVTYWKSANTTFGAGFRQTKGGNMLPGGSTISDVFGNVTAGIGREWSVKAFVQYERWLLPVLQPTAQHNGSGWVQIMWTPQNSVLRRIGKAK